MPSNTDPVFSIYKPIPRIIKTEPKATIKQEPETHIQVPVKRELDDNDASETPQLKKPKVEGERAIEKPKAKKVKKSKEESAEDKAESKAVEAQTEPEEKKTRFQASIEHAERRNRNSAEWSRIDKAIIKAKNERNVLLLKALAVKQKKARAEQSKLDKEKNEQLQLPRQPPEHDITKKYNTRGAKKRAAALRHGVAEEHADEFWWMSEEKEKMEAKISDLNQKLQLLNREIGNLKK